jgi:hypothetical protein
LRPAVWLPRPKLWPLLVLGLMTTSCGRPVTSTADLAGCYGPERIAAFMRPADPRVMVIRDGRVFDQQGASLSRISIGASRRDGAVVDFMPGVGFSKNENDQTIVTSGPVRSAVAHANGNDVSISTDLPRMTLERVRCD